MKVVAAVLLLGLVIASVVCEPEEPSNEAETERKHRHKHGRGDYHDDEYHSRDNHPSYPRNCPNCVKSCACQETLAKTELSSINGCNNAAGAANTCTAAGAALGAVNTGAGFCTDTTAVSFPGFCTVPANPSFCANPAFLGGDGAGGNKNGVTVAACNGPAAGVPAAPPSLCYQIKCTSDGFINIKADAVPNTCCGATDYLFLYKGATPGATPVITGNGIVPGVTAVGSMNLDFSEQCKKDDTYWICEKNGIIISSSIKATLSTQPTGITTCAAGTTLSCRG
jgi:hypothetical protein